MRVIAALLFGLTVLAEEPVDPGVVDRIKTEAFDRSAVMDQLYYLADVHGPRLTGSPEFDDAAKWAAGRLKEYGLQNVHLERWGPFGRSWSLQQSSLELIQPRYQALAAVPLAWSAPTGGPVTGELIITPWKPSYRDGPKKFDEDFAAYKVNGRANYAARSYC
jgi:carboxypeptidase Q